MTARSSPRDPLARADRTRAAAAGVKRPVASDDAASRSEAVLSMPVSPATTKAQREEGARLRAEAERDAARLVARMTMLRSHGCTGKHCRGKAHQADREWRDTALMALGLRYDPESDWLPGHGYTSAPRNRRKGGEEE